MTSPTYTPPTYIVAAFDALGWRVVGLRPAGATIGLERWHATIEHIASGATMRLDGDGAIAVLEALLRYAQADAPYAIDETPIELGGARYLLRPAATILTAPTPVTAATITDEQIRELRQWAVEQRRTWLSVVCGSVLDAGAMPDPRALARADLAAAWNLRRRPVRSVVSERVSQGAWIVVDAAGAAIGAIVEEIDWTAYRVDGAPQLLLGEQEHRLAPEGTRAATWRDAVEALAAARPRVARRR